MRGLGIWCFAAPFLGFGCPEAWCRHRTLGQEGNGGMQMVDTYHDGGNCPLYDGHGEAKGTGIFCRGTWDWVTGPRTKDRKTPIIPSQDSGNKGPRMADWRSKWSVKFNDAGTTK